MVLHCVFGRAAVSLALLALVHPRKRRLNAVGGIVGKRQAHGAGGGDGQQVAVANTVLANRCLQRIRQAAGEGALRQIGLRREFGKHALLARQIDRCSVSGVAHALGNARGHGTAFGQVVAHAQHGQRVAHTGKAHANAALGHGLFALLRQGPEGDVQHVIKRAHLQRYRLGEGVKVKSRNAIKPERMAHKTCEDDGTEVAAAVGGKGLFAALPRHQSVKDDGIAVILCRVKHCLRPDRLDLCDSARKALRLAQDFVSHPFAVPGGFVVE